METEPSGQLAIVQPILNKEIIIIIIIFYMPLFMPSDEI